MPISSTTPPPRSENFSFSTAACRIVAAHEKGAKGMFSPPLPFEKKSGAEMKVKSDEVRLKRTKPERIECGEIPIHSAGLLSRLMFLWVLPYVWQIYRRGSVDGDILIYPQRYPIQSSCERISHAIRDEIQAQGGGGALSLIKIFFIFTFKRFCGTLVLRLLTIGGTVSIALFGVRSIVRDFEMGNERTSACYLHILLLFSLLVTKALVWQQAFLLNYIDGIRLRSATLLYIAMQSISSLISSCNVNILTLTSNESRSFFEFALHSNTIFVSVAMTFLCIGVSFYVVGPWSLLGSSVFLLYFCVEYFIAKRILHYKKRALLITDQRLQLVKEIFSSIRIVKLSCLESFFYDKLSTLCSREWRYYRRGAVLFSLSISTAFVAPVLSNLLTFVPHFAFGGRRLLSSEAFVFISIWAAARSYVNLFSHSLKSLADVRIALHRLQTICLLPPRNVYEKDARANRSLVLNNVSASYKIQPPKPEQNAEERENILVDDDYVIREISCVFNRGALIGISGCVGAGKTSFLKAIVGSLRLSPDSTISRDAALAYVAQDDSSLLGSATIRENVIFGESYNSDRYNRIIDAVSLTNELSESLQVSTLSGGQKQRVLLARALYSRNQLVLLDSSLSALDAHVADEVFNRAIIGYLRNEQHRCVIFVCEEARFLRYCDQVVVLDGGRIVEQGEHHELLQNQFSTYSKLVGHQPVSDSKPQPPAILTSNKSFHFRSNSATSSKSAAIGGCGEETELFASNCLITNDENVIEVEQNLSELPAGKRFSTGRLNHRVYVSFVRRGGGWLAAFAVLLLNLITFGLVAFSNYWLANWIDKMTLNESDVNKTRPETDFTGNESNVTSSSNGHYTEFLWWYAGIYFGSVLLIIVFMVLKALAITTFCLRASRSYHDTMIRKLLHSDLNFFESVPLGQITVKFSRDIAEINSMLSLFLEQFLSYVAMVLSALVVIAFVLPAFLLVALLLVVFLFCLFTVYHVAQRELRRTEFATFAPVITLIGMIIDSTDVIASYGKENWISEKLTRLLNRNAAAFMLQYCCMRWSALSLELLVACVVASVAFLLVVFRPAPAMVGLAISQALLITGILQYAVRVLMLVESSFTSVERVLRYMHTVPQEPRPITAWSDSVRSVRNLVNTRRSRAFSIQFHDVSMAASSRQILRNVSFEIKANESVGIVGRTGAGKSSLITALTRLKPFSGSILLNASDVSNMPLNDLRGSISVITQHSHLFSLSLRENLDPYGLRCDEEILSTLSDLGLSDLISRLDGALDYVINSHNDVFSAGERQLLCLARALLSNATCFIFDEATSNVDPETESKIAQHMERLLSEKTLLVIAHRVSSVMKCDRIIYIDEGRIIENDLTQNLLANPSSSFYQLVAAASSTS